MGILSEQYAAFTQGTTASALARAVLRVAREEPSAKEVYDSRFPHTICFGQGHPPVEYRCLDGWKLQGSDANSTDRYARPVAVADALLRSAAYGGYLLPQNGGVLSPYSYYEDELVEAEDDGRQRFYFRFFPADSPNENAIRMSAVPASVGHGWEDVPAPCLTVRFASLDNPQAWVSVHAMLADAEGTGTFAAAAEFTMGGLSLWKAVGEDGEEGQAAIVGFLHLLEASGTPREFLEAWQALPATA